MQRRAPPAVGLNTRSCSSGGSDAYSGSTSSVISIGEASMIQRKRFGARASAGIANARQLWLSTAAKPHITTITIKPRDCR